MPKYRPYLIKLEALMNKFVNLKDKMKDYMARFNKAKKDCGFLVMKFGNYLTKSSI